MHGRADYPTNMGLWMDVFCAIFWQFLIFATCVLLVGALIIALFSPTIRDTSTAVVLDSTQNLSSITNARQNLTHT